ncbi:hypothetical protein ACIOVF_26895 [Pseudomonas sp. NPDC087612]|uniref:hypothetical protein n=1 Tax=Pseudomonas TaxID=286 RepID=UPI00088FDFE1|nr:MULTISPECIES: hypothetical protein [unclassified Pseudomonas]NLU59588.1 hypothetical protein [Pseudomonas sp. BIGb0427]QPG64596.1 hypothetical protein HFV04_007425 [Pseudomonas sp. BIGb0427]QVM96659.1 hypothetical protein JYG36_00260 [Pseudomonas sp. SORT22]UVL56478.1 hypothetical protein LOY22_00430 [Pseudomonas sp. B21-035]UVM56081.1 hypothetical protein LOY37_00430 [Pseudomonas sp. B21-012]
MNRQTATLVQVSSLQLRQGLFFSLALLLTLIAGQLYNSWETARSAEQLAAQAALVAQVQAQRPVAALQARVALSTPVTTPAVVDTAAPRDRWVF